MKQKTIMRWGVLVLSVLVFSIAAWEISENRSSEKELKAEATPQTNSVNERLEVLENKYHAKLGVYAANGNEKVKYNAQERFAYTSTYKAIISGLLLKNRTEEELQKKIFFSKEDLVDYSPITEKFVDKGMTLKAIIHAAVAYSDNTAGNLLLDEIGGTKKFQEELRLIGDHTTISSRYETDLNSAVPGDLRDTTTPEAFGTDLQRLTSPKCLDPQALSYFKQTLVDNTTGDKLIRAGVPEGYIVGDKTGAGSYGTRNDIAIIFKENSNGLPLVWAVFSKMDREDAQYNDQLIADVAKVLSEELAL
ncbi:class A beta-lactamase [Listeria kieliensis]|uniref:Beta-lactamase n=1 Tax=Listeria kieliensis TaxID=1621700 RepID=A0A3D8TS10_9LIST|nr:class A beta-lactamase [Listeria kieliensis]RDX01384.1 hypothetical protein UR08_10750 [Listeria kieliensis]